MEQKRIFLNLRENSRGRYLRIVEVKLLDETICLQKLIESVLGHSPHCDVAVIIQVTGNNRSTIIVPSSGLQQFRTLLDEFIE